jgi:ABC-type transport system involved in multi-copper enzyme maturation permease subunit
MKKYVSFFGYQSKPLVTYFLTCLFISLAVVAIFFGTVKAEYFGYYIQDRNPGRIGWIYFIQAFLPFLLTLINGVFLIAGYQTLFNKEYANRSIGSWLVLPMSRTSIFLIKIFTIMFYQAIIFLMCMIVTLIIVHSLNVPQYDGHFVSATILNYFSAFIFVMVLFAVLLMLDFIKIEKTGLKLGLAVLILLYHCGILIVKFVSQSELMQAEYNNTSAKSWWQALWYLQYVSLTMLFAFSYRSDVNVLSDKTGNMNLQYSQKFIVYAGEYITPIVVGIVVIVLLFAFYIWRMHKRDYSI